MHNDLEQIAQLKFGKELESISSETREKVRELQNEYAAKSGSLGIRSGQQEATIGRTQIEGSERIVRRFFKFGLTSSSSEKGISEEKMSTLFQEKLITILARELDI